MMFNCRASIITSISAGFTVGGILVVLIFYIFAVLFSFGYLYEYQISIVWH